MAFVSVDSLRPPPPLNSNFALWQLGFRPFFLLASLFSLLAISIWLFSLNGLFGISGITFNIKWHAHEMIFGYGTAVIAGFLLTAVRNWTDLDTLKGAPLAALAALWVAARIGHLSNFMPIEALMALDLLFLPLLALAIALPIYQRRQWNNMVFVPLILVIFSGNILYYLQPFLTDTQWSLSSTGEILGMMGIVSILIVMGGRVIPFFIERGVEGNLKRREYRWVEMTALPATLIALILEPIYSGYISAIPLLIAALLQMVRLSGWYLPGLWKNPLIWVLYCGYAGIGLSLALLALSEWGVINRTTALHALTVGGIGITTLGMMARVALGHTGRDMLAHPLTRLAFVMVTIALILRLMPLLFANTYMLWINLSALMWIVAFALFSWVYLPILIRPRIDGRPG